MRILVTGATGTVGRHVVGHLAGAGMDVRALTRRPETAGLPAGVQVVGGDLERVEDLGPVFDDVDRLYLLDASGSTERIVELAKRAGVRRIVVLSSATAGIEGDLGGATRRAMELAVEASGLEWTHVRPGMFAANLLDWAEPIRTDGVVREPYADARQAPVHEADIAAVAAAALLSDEHVAAIYTLTGPESLTKREQAAAIGAVLGKDVRFEESTPDQWRDEVSAYMPEYVIEWLLSYWCAVTQVPENVLPTVETVTGRPARSLTQWARGHAEAFC